MNSKQYSYYLGFYKSRKVALLTYASIFKAILFAKESKGTFEFYSSPTLIHFLARYLKMHFQFLHFCDLTCTDYPSKLSRFELSYFFRKLVFYQISSSFGFLRPRSLGQSILFRVLAQGSEFTAVDSIVTLFPASAWAEREVWDLYGVFFSGNQDLRRILTDYGFQGHPFRKDFPLSGYLEVRYDYSKKRVVYEPIQLSQEFRLFDFTSPWSSPK